MLIDTHTHLYLEHFDEDRDVMIRRAEDVGVKRFYLPNIDSSSIESLLKLESDYPGKCFAMMGLHPCSVKEDYNEELSVVDQWLSKRPFVAIGEIGIDLYWDKSTLKHQQSAFLHQVERAIQYDYPIVIHSRESIDLIIEMLQEFSGKVKGVFHCFTGTINQAHQIMDLDFMMGIGGVLTFKNAGLSPIVSEIPLNYLILETDSPYLSPVPHRGKRNESSYVKLVSIKLAEILGLEAEMVENQTTLNAMKLFHDQEN